MGLRIRAPNSRVLPVSNGGSDPVTIELVYKRTDTATALPAGPLLRVWVSTYDPARAPIELEGLTPLCLRVDAPADGTLETSAATIRAMRRPWTGRPSRPGGSYDGLVDVPLSRGPHEVVVRFVGTAAFRLASLWQMIAWGVAGLIAAVGVARALGRAPTAAGTL